MDSACFPAVLPTLARQATGISVEHPQIPAFSPKQIGSFIKTYE
jgi:hypothetical protein